MLASTFLLSGVSGEFDLFDESSIVAEEDDTAEASSLPDSRV